MKVEDFNAELERGSRQVVEKHRRIVHYWLMTAARKAGWSGPRFVADQYIDDAITKLSTIIAPHLRAAIKEHLREDGVGIEALGSLQWAGVDVDRADISKLAAQLTIDPPRSVPEAPDEPTPKMQTPTVAKASPEVTIPDSIEIRLAPQDRNAILAALTALKPERQGRLTITSADGKVTTLERESPAVAPPGPTVMPAYGPPPAARAQAQPPPPIPGNVHGAARRFWNEEANDPGKPPMSRPSTDGSTPAAPNQTSPPRR